MGNTAKKLTALLCATTLALSLAGCGKKAAGDGADSPQTTAAVTSAAPVASDGKFSLCYNSSSGLNPMTTADANNQLVCNLIYENMVTVDNSFNLQPNVVTAWKSDDGKAWTFTVATDRVFSDGNKLTAKDVAYSLKTALNNARFKNRFDGLISAISATDDTTFTVTLSKANMLFPMLMTVPVIENNSFGNTYPVGSGPYAYASDHQSLTANTHYAQADSLPVETVYLQKYGSVNDYITKFEDATIDLVENDPSTSSNIGFGSANELRGFNTTNLHFIGFNRQSRYFSDGQLQRALSYAFDRAYMADTLMQGSAVAACSPINPASPLYNRSYDEKFGYDLDKCKTALENIGVKDYDSDGKAEYMTGENAVDLSLTLLVCMDSGAKVGLANKFASDMGTLGVTVNVKSLSWDEYKKALTAGSFDLYYCEVKLASDFDLSPIFATSGSVNYSRGTDSDCVGLINSYLAAGEADRQNACDALCQHIADTAAIIPICFEKHQIITHKGVITGMTVNQNDPMNGFAKWKINIT